MGHFTDPNRSVNLHKRATAVQIYHDQVGRRNNISTFTSEKSQLIATVEDSPKQKQFSQCRCSDGDVDVMM